MGIIEILKKAQENGFTVKWNDGSGALQILTAQKDENVHIGKISEVNPEFLKIRFPLRIALIPIPHLKEITYSSLDEKSIY